MIHKKNLGAAPPRLQRMLLETQGYEMQIKYRPGSEITLADGLSRLPNMKQNKEINLDIKIQMVQFSDDKVTTIKTETKSDPVLSALLEVITVGWPEKRHKLSVPLRTNWGYREELSVEDGIILKGGRISWINFTLLTWAWRKQNFEQNPLSSGQASTMILNKLPDNARHVTHWQNPKGKNHWCHMRYQHVHGRISAQTSCISTTTTTSSSLIITASFLSSVKSKDSAQVMLSSQSWKRSSVNTGYQR